MNSAKFLKTAWAFAGSRNFSVFVLVMSVTYALILAVFRIGFRVEERWLYILADLWPYRLLYALFFLNLILFGIDWVPAVIRRCNSAWLPQRTEHPGRFDGATPIPDTGFRVEDLKQYLRRRGYRVRDAESDMPRAPGSVRHAGAFHASRGRYSLLGNLLFHAGFLLLLWGAATNALYRFEGTAIITEDAAFTGRKDEYRTVAAGSAAAFPAVDFDVGKITAEFWEGRLFFTRLEAQLMHRGGRDLAQLSSAAQVGGAHVTLSGYAYAPRYLLKNKDGRIISSARVKLNIFGPGSEDYFFVPGLPHKIFVAFYPDHAEVDGKPINRSMNPANPAYFLRIMRGRIPVFTGLVKPGAWADYDGMRISFPSFVKTGSFQIVRNPGHPFIWAAFIAMALGLAWRLLYYRKEVALWQDADGRTWLSGHFDHCRRLNAEWLAGLADEFREPAA